MVGAAPETCLGDIIRARLRGRTTPSNVYASQRGAAHDDLRPHPACVQQKVI
jgi:hypothetical protein